jgi:hypothetical protein
MDVGPKRDLLGTSPVAPCSYILLSEFNIQAIWQMLFAIELIFNLVYIIRCLNGLIPCISKINRMVSRHNYLPMYVINSFKNKI